MTYAGRTIKNCVFLIIILGLTVALRSYLQPNSQKIRHYTLDELITLNCDELSEKHEEIVSSHHDAAIRYHRETGSFPENNGNPQVDELPFVIVMKKWRKIMI